MLLPRSIAIRGVEFSARVRSLNGLWDAFIILIPRRFIAAREAQDATASGFLSKVSAQIARSDVTAEASSISSDVVRTEHDATATASTLNHTAHRRQ